MKTRMKRRTKLAGVLFTAVLTMSVALALADHGHGHGAAQRLPRDAVDHQFTGERRVLCHDSRG